MAPEPGHAYLAWGMRVSLLDYVRRSGGSVSFGAPADWADGAFRFPGSAGHPFRFRGEASLRAHGGLLAVDIVDPWIEETDGSLSLTISDLARQRRITVARLLEVDRSNDGIDYAATLAEEGVALFGGFYPVGTELARVSVGGPSGVRAVRRPSHND